MWFKRKKKQTTYLFCPQCDNELVSSNSYRTQIEKPNTCIWVFECSKCNHKSYWRPDIAPVVILCNEEGVPKTD